MTSATILEIESTADEALKREFLPAFSPIQIEKNGDSISDITIRHAAPNELLNTLNGELSANAKESAHCIANAFPETTEVGNPKAVWIQSMKKSVSATVAVFTAQEWEHRLDSSTGKFHRQRYGGGYDRQNYP